jgi:hypothetical protein
MVLFRTAPAGSGPRRKLLWMLVLPGTPFRSTDESGSRF